MAAEATIEISAEQIEQQSKARREQRRSRIVWFEIPVEDMDRAQKFYEEILSTEMKRVQFGPENCTVFPYEPPAIGGCLIQGPGLKPGHGVIPALNADPSLDVVLGKVQAAGGSIIQTRTELPHGMGCYARIEDTEGNLVGLHAMR